MVLDGVFSSTSDAFGDFGPFVADFLVSFDQYPFLINILCSTKMVLDGVFSSTSDAFGDFGPFVADFLVPFDQYPFLIFIPFTFLKV